MESGVGVNSTPMEHPWTGPHEESGWRGKAAALLYIFFLFEVGAFLLIFPWLEELWDHNYFAGFGPAWARLWASPYVRGAISGLGLINILFSFSELSRLRRFPKRDDTVR
jgi:hypothetical protein